MKLKGTNTAQAAPVQRPSTAAEWRKRISELKQELAGAEALVTERRQVRRTAAGTALLTGQGADSIATLEGMERDAERTLDTVKAAIELAEVEGQKFEAAEREAAEAERRGQYAAKITEIRQAASVVDAIFTDLVGKLQVVDGLLSQYRAMGGRTSGTLKGSVTRAALLAGMRPFLATEYVGINGSFRSLAEDLNYEPSIVAMSTESKTEEFVTASLGGEFPA